MSEGSETKKHAASQTKLNKQRDKGSVANSQEASGFMACGLGILLLAVTAGAILSHLTELIHLTTDQIGNPFQEARSIVGDASGETFTLILVPLLIMTLIAAFVTAILYNKGFVFSIKPALPKMERVSPKSGVKRIYGKRGLVETPVAAVRIVIWIGCTIFLGIWPLITLMRSPHCLGACLTNELTQVAWPLIACAVLLILLSAGIDMLVQRGLFLGEQKMTETERKNEQKDQHGTPEIRQERRRRMRESTRSRREPALRNATMCFYHGDRAVGIEFRPPKVTLPFVMARADTREEAQAIRDAIRAKGWPEKEHQALVNAGFSAPLGDIIDENAFADFVDCVEELFADSR